MPFASLLLSTWLLHLGQASATAPTSKEDMHKRFTERANNPAEVKRISESTMGCNVHEAGESGQNFRTTMAGGSMTSRGPARVAVDQNPILPDHRAPKFWAPTERVDAAGLTSMLEDGKATTVASLKGKVVLVFVYKAECKWTTEIMNEIIKLQSMDANAPFTVLPISIGEGGWPKIADFRRKNSGAIPAEFRIYRPSAEAGKGISALGQIEYTPATFILDRRGRVAWRIYGGVKGAIQDRLNHTLTE